jgi:hypothetical protein
LPILRGNTRQQAHQRAKIKAHAVKKKTSKVATNPTEPREKSKPQHAPSLTSNTSHRN